MKREIFSNTCFIGHNETPYGKYELSENCYIDFRAKKIYLDDEPVKMPEAQVDFLIRLIVRSPELASYSDLIFVTKGRSGDIDTLRTLKNKMIKNVGEGLKNITIEYRKNYGYIISDLPVKIRRYDKTDGSKIDNIPAFLRQQKLSEQSETEEKAKEASCKFLHSGAEALLDEDRHEVLSAMEKLSEVFNLISDFQCTDETLFSKAKPESVVVDMYNCITSVCRKTAARNVLKIEGPLGSYKNRIMQYIYLMIKESDEDILPFYIDLAYYERLAEQNRRVTEREFVEMFREDLLKFKAAIEQEPDRIPLLLLDGIRDFRRGNEAVYELISRQLSETDCRLVACVDCDFTMNHNQKFRINPIAPDEFEANVRINSMSLYNTNRSTLFIEKCLKVFDVNIPENISAEDIYSSLLKLNFSYIDAYWLVSMLRSCWRDIMSPYSNLARIYESFCLSVVQDYSTLNAAVEMAYNFEYGSKVFSTSNIYFDMCWRLIRKHRSILEYLIARWYMSRMDELNFERDSADESLRKLGFFNMVLQKNVTRFVLAMLKGDDEYEHKIMYIARNFYGDLTLHGKCELAFWMGRLENGNRKAQCRELLKKFRKDALDMYENGRFERISQKRDAAFFLRSVSISLMYENDEEAFAYYMNSLLTDKIANSVNRGFHLEYYGDKPYNPTNSLLDYEDDVTKGENTLAFLCISLDARIRRKEPITYAAVLEVVTLCTLIQARLEGGVENALDPSPYIIRCIFCLGLSCVSPVLDEIPDVKNFLLWMYEKFKENASGKPHHQASVYNKFSQASETERAGWKIFNVPEPENIVEHMYNCWLIGMLYLPKEYNDPEYDKNTVLNMLLLHDLGETVTGDIPRPQKEKNREAYDRAERGAMYDLLFSGTYPSSVDLSEYLGYWNVWDQDEDERGINALIAKDIDNLQTTYKFCDFYLKNPGLFDEDGVRYWLGDIRIMKTQLGKKIMDTIVVNNPRFEEILEIIR